jgi:hypothetical protein
VTDADGAMAFFYPSLNCWVVSRLLKLYVPMIGHQRRYVPKQVPPCRIPADIQLTFLVWVRGKIVHTFPPIAAVLGFAEIFPR